MEDNEESPASLEAIGVREHAALVGLLAERAELIVRGALYVVHGVPPENVARILGEIPDAAPPAVVPPVLNSAAAPTGRFFDRRVSVRTRA